MEALVGLNPWPFLALQLTSSIFTLGFTTPSSVLRPAILPIQFTCAYIICLNMKNFIPRLGWAATICCISTMFAFSYLEMAILSKWSFENQGPAPTISKSKTGAENGNGKKGELKMERREDAVWERVKFGFGSLMSFRDLNTPHETKNCPHFSSSDPSYVPSRSRFLLATLPKFMLCYLLLDIIESQPPPPDAQALFSSSKIPVFRGLAEIRGEEVALRVGASLGFWLMLYCMLSAMSFFLGLVCVGLGVSEVKEWRPLMGPISAAYTVRRFWGKFWHQGTRKIFSNPSIYLIDNFPLPLPSLVSRYAKIFLTFYLSGLVHVTGDWVFMPWSESWTLQFFIAQAFGVMVEDFVQWIWKSLFEEGRGDWKAGGLKKDGNERTKMWKKVVGFVWVLAFMLFWSTPAWFFPNAQRNTGAVEGKLLPFSVIGHFFEK
ncbi:hypothetical protein BDZ45DRAFT_687269 [Acephala macrosclerotiorum]|nr:hypothetical protein BDZ45DRAFT_687269 [Acephala macrosclerotiorum]